MLYDGVDWQIPEAFRPVIRCVGQHFNLSVIVHKKPGVFSESQLYLGLGAPSPISGNNSCLLTWHKIEKRNIVADDNVQVEINVNFGKFWKCGFYDWRLVSVSSDGKLSPLEIIGRPAPVYPTVDDYDADHYDGMVEDEVGSLAQGRFIVHARGFRDHSFHEVQVDQQDARVDKQ
jgi:starch synthase